MKIIFYTIAIVFVLFSSESAFTQNIYKRLYPEKCDSLIQANSTNPNFVILDVRTDNEWRGDHLNGSINRSTGDSNFQQKLALLHKHKIYLLHCKSGGRSAGAFTKMKNLNFSEVYEMIGGINAWKNNSYPTTSNLAPKLMLVSYKKFDGVLSDTVTITITNRANEQLTFQNVSINDEHFITHNFDEQISIEGADDYTFDIFHAPDYSAEDSTEIRLESNGGLLELKVMVENEHATAIQSFTKNTIQIFPNPANNKVFITNTNSIDEVNIYNLLGKKVFQRSDHLYGKALCISHLNEGLHLVQIKTGNTFITKRLLIKR